jgi:hypothetical protein
MYALAKFLYSIAKQTHTNIQAKKASTKEQETNNPVGIVSFASIYPDPFCSSLCLDVNVLLIFPCHFHCPSYIS